MCNINDSKEETKRIFNEKNETKRNARILLVARFLIAFIFIFKFNF